jgi:hypothetical protein
MHAGFAARLSIFSIPGIVALHMFAFAGHRRVDSVTVDYCKPDIRLVDRPLSPSAPSSRAMLDYLHRTRGVREGRFAWIGHKKIGPTVYEE